MSYLGDLIFGSKDKLDVKQFSTLTPEQKAALDSILGTFKAQGGADFQPEQYNGELAAGLSDREMLSLDALEKKALDNASDPLGDASKTALLQLIQAGGSSGGDFENFFKTNVEDPALKDFQTNVNPAISRTFGGSSFFSSDRAKADQQAGDALIRSLTASRADLALKDRESSADRLLQAIGLSSSMENSDIDNLIKTMQAFSTEREVRQNQDTAEYNDFLRQQQDKTNRIQQILSTLGVQAFENVGHVQPGQTGLLPTFAYSFVGGAGKALGAAKGAGGAKLSL